MGTMSPRGLDPPGGSLVESYAWMWGTHHAFKLINPPRRALTQVHTPSPDPPPRAGHPEAPRKDLGEHRCRPRGRSQRHVPGLFELIKPWPTQFSSSQRGAGLRMAPAEGIWVAQANFAAHQPVSKYGTVPPSHGFPGTGKLVAAVPQNCHPPILPWPGFIPTCKKFDENV